MKKIIIILVFIYLYFSNPLLFSQQALSNSGSEQNKSQKSKKGKIKESTKEEIITNIWAVKLSINENPFMVAKQLGAENLGQVGELPDTYIFLFSHKLIKNSEILLKKNTRIKWYERQIKKKRYTRSPFEMVQFRDPLFNEQWHLKNTGQKNGSPGEDVNVMPVWEEGYTGQGIVIGIVDDGLQYLHPDLKNNYISSLSYDFNYKDFDPYPDLMKDRHGTSVAGVAAAISDETCGVGVAYNANLAGLRLISAPCTDADEASALSYKNNSIHIYSNSWGPYDNGHLEGPGRLASEALMLNTEFGRNGLGNIFVWAAGNGLQAGDNVNYDGYANSRYTIAVSAVDNNGMQSIYSEPGAAILIAAPSSKSFSGKICGIVTTDIMGSDGYNEGDCSYSFGGTSSATPLISGLIALILQANPDLGWRDVQYILIKSAYKNDPNDNDWTVNGAGFNINHKYGFGRANAKDALDIAKNWDNVPVPAHKYTFIRQVNQAIPDNNPEGIFSFILVPDKLNIKLEHVDIFFSSKHIYRGDLMIILSSPHGTKSILAERREENKSDYKNWRFMTVRNWGEYPKGRWSLNVKDLGLWDSGSFENWKLCLYGAGPKVQLEPIANPDNANTKSNNSVDIDVLINDYDPNEDRLEISGVTSPDHGQAKILNNKIRYSPDLNYFGQDNFTYKISDENGGYANAKVTVDVKWLKVPVVKTIKASDVTCNSAVLNGSINPNSLQIKYYFQYGNTTEFGKETNAEYCNGKEEVQVNSALTGLDINTIYYFRLVASSENGVSQGDTLQFSTNIPAIEAEEINEVSLNSGDKTENKFFIYNKGCGRLEFQISILFSDQQASGWVKAVPTIGSIDSFNNKKISLYYDATNLKQGVYNAVLKIIHNDINILNPLIQNIILNVKEQNKKPEIQISPSQFDVFLSPGQSIKYKLKLYNKGNDILKWNLRTVAKNIDKYKGQSYEYIYTNSDQENGPIFNWIDISGTGRRVLGLLDDNFVGPINIGFGFPYYGNKYNQLYIASNGMIGFDKSYALKKYYNRRIPSGLTPNNILAWLWDDLSPQKGEVYYQKQNNSFIIQFKDIGQYGKTGKSNIEAILYDSGTILLQYKDFQNGFNVERSSVGIENRSGKDGIGVVFNEKFLHEKLAIRFSPGCSWILSDKTSGNINPEKEDIVFITLKSCDSKEIYTGNISIFSNDPVRPVVRIPVIIRK